MPPQHVPLALASFNIGVEAGQLSSVAVVALGWRALIHGAHAAQQAKAWAVYVLGSASVYWCLERALALWQA